MRLLSRAQASEQEHERKRRRVSRRRELVWDLVQRRLTVRTLDVRDSRNVYEQHFAPHHYLEGELPSLYGVIARDGSGAAVAFHSVTEQFGPHRIRQNSSISITVFAAHRAWVAARARTVEGIY